MLAHGAPLDKHARMSLFVVMVFFLKIKRESHHKIEHILSLCHL